MRFLSRIAAWGLYLFVVALVVCAGYVINKLIWSVSGDVLSHGGWAKVAVLVASVLAACIVVTVAGFAVAVLIVAVGRGIIRIRAWQASREADEDPRIPDTAPEAVMLGGEASPEQNRTGAARGTTLKSTAQFAWHQGF